MTQGILVCGVLAFALWLYPGPAGAQQPENTVVCVDGLTTVLNYGDNAPDCAIDHVSDSDPFVFNGADGTSVRVNVSGATNDLDPRVEVRDPTGAVLADQFCSAGFFDTCSVAVDLDLTLTGQYLIALSDAGLDNTGGYSISLNCIIGSCLTITPRTDFETSGLPGGPFDTIKTYTLTNNGALTVDFTASASENFVSLSQESGTLPGGGSTTVTVSFNANADNLAPGIHAAQVDFVNATNGQGDTDRQVELNVKCPGSLEVTPATAYQPSGPAGGPFAPDSKSYKLTNLLIDPGGGTLCGSDIEFSIETIGDYIDVSPTSGMLEAGGSTTVTVSLNNNANGLADGTYDGTVTFTNTTFNFGDTERAVTLTVESTIVDPTSLDWLGPILEYLMREPDKPQPPESP
ncbi:MAG: hypothetical protein O7A03_05965 [Alphaproteobacteria bacterium]|nr:hypothetical protein [Alphaproteobacteria bacterium]